jgi:hypothetical protein
MMTDDRAMMSTRFRRPKEPEAEGGDGVVEHEDGVTLMMAEGAHAGIAVAARRSTYRCACVCTPY